MGSGLDYFVDEQHGQTYWFEWKQFRWHHNHHHYHYHYHRIDGYKHGYGFDLFGQ